MKRISATQYYWSKFVLWVLFIAIVPTYLWYIPTGKYTTDQESIKVTNSASGKIVEFDATNVWNYTIHAKYIPNGRDYLLYINGQEVCSVQTDVSQEKWYKKETHRFYMFRSKYILITILLIFLQVTFWAVFLWFGLSVGDNCIHEYFARKKEIVPGLTGKDCEIYTIKTIRLDAVHISGYDEDDIWFSKVFGLFPTAERVNRINEFFGFDLDEEYN